MPRFDGTGPIGRGPMTGRGFGYCRTAYQPTQQPVAPSGENLHRSHHSKYPRMPAMSSGSGTVDALDGGYQPDAVRA